MALVFEIAQPTPEEIELLENDLYVDWPVTGATNFEDINLFSGDKWSGLRYYLTQLNACFTIYDLMDRRDSIIEDMTNLRAMSPEMVEEFDRLLDVVVRCYHI